MQLLHRKLQRASREMGVVVTTPSAVKSLFLYFIDCMQLAEQVVTPAFGAAYVHEAHGVAEAEVPPEQEAKGGTASLEDVRSAARQVHKLELRADALAAILRLFRRGVALIDEVDMVMHPLRSELNFPIGDKSRVPMTGVHLGC